MEEKDRNMEERNKLTETKPTWEAPILYNLNKKETMGGNNVAYTESYGNDHAASGS